MSMEFRLFKLINEVGAEYDLTDPTHFFASPDGLGFEREFSVMQTGDAFVSLESGCKGTTFPENGKFFLLIRL